MITLQQDLLQSALNAVARVSAKNSLQAVFALVQLNVNTDGILYLSCFNGETAVRATLNVDCNEALAVCVDAATFKAVVETLVGQIRLHIDGTMLVIQGAATRTSLRIVDEALPMLDENDLHPLVTCSGGTFRSLLRVLPFASTDESRAILQVVHLMLDKTQAMTLAADGYTAACVVERMEGSEGEGTLSLPLFSARLLSQLVEDSDVLRIGEFNHRYLFQILNPTSSKNILLATVTVNGNFPAAQIKTLMGEARTNAMATLQLQQASLLQSIRMVNAMGTQSTFLKVSNGVIKIASAETETGQARNIMEGTAEGQNTQAWLSALYLKRATEAIKGELTLRITSHTKPLMIEAGNFSAVIMPMLSDGFKDPFPEEEAIAIHLPDMATA